MKQTSFIYTANILLSHYTLSAVSPEVTISCKKRILFASSMRHVGWKWIRTCMNESGEEMYVRNCEWKQKGKRGLTTLKDTRVKLSLQFAWHNSHIQTQWNFFFNYATLREFLIQFHSLSRNCHELAFAWAFANCMKIQAQIICCSSSSSKISSRFESTWA